MWELKAALFDLDGTLFDTEPQYSVFWESMGKYYHPELPDFHNLIKGTTLDSIFENYFPNDIDRKLVTRKLDEWERNMKYAFVKGADSFVKHLKKQGVKCAIVTSSNKKKIECVRDKVPDLDVMFDKIITAEMFAKSKPFPDSYLFAANDLNVHVRECVVFEDAFNGIKAAKNANMFTIGLATSHVRETLVNLCDFVIDDFSEINYNVVIDLFNNFNNK